MKRKPKIPCIFSDSFDFFHCYDINKEKMRSNAGLLSELLDSLSGSYEDDVDIQLPRFRLEISIDLKKELAALGVNNLFNESTDLSGIK